MDFSLGWEGCEGRKRMSLHCVWILHWIQTREEAEGAIKSICSWLVCQQQKYAQKAKGGNTAGTWDKYPPVAILPEVMTRRGKN